MEQQDIKKRLEDITNLLLINGTFVQCPGLFYGKMGIAVFFFHYARYTDNDVFQDYAVKLIEELQSQIHTSTTVRYDRGLAGIGSAIEYLVQQDFLDPEADDILSDFDARMFRAVMYEPYPDFSFQEGLMGWGRYLLSRMAGRKSIRDLVSIQKALFHILDGIENTLPEKIPEAGQMDVLCFLLASRRFPEFSLKSGEILESDKMWGAIKNAGDFNRSFHYLGSSFLGDVVRQYLYQLYFQPFMPAGNHPLSYPEITGALVPPAGIGLLDGLAGEALSLLYILEPEHTSWVQLF